MGEAKEQSAFMKEWLDWKEKSADVVTPTMAIDKLVELIEKHKEDK